MNTTNIQNEEQYNAEYDEKVLKYKNQGIEEGVTYKFETTGVLRSKYIEGFFNIEFDRFEYWTSKDNYEVKCYMGISQALERINLGDWRQIN